MLPLKRKVYAMLSIAETSSSQHGMSMPVFQHLRLLICCFASTPTEELLSFWKPSRLLTLKNNSSALLIQPEQSPCIVQLMGAGLAVAHVRLNTALLPLSNERGSGQSACNCRQPCLKPGFAIH